MVEVRELLRGIGVFDTFCVYRNLLQVSGALAPTCALLKLRASVVGSFLGAVGLYRKVIPGVGNAIAHSFVVCAGVSLC